MFIAPPQPPGGPGQPNTVRRASKLDGAPPACYTSRAGHYRRRTLWRRRREWRYFMGQGSPSRFPSTPGRIPGPGPRPLNSRSPTCAVPASPIVGGMRGTRGAAGVNCAFTQVYAGLDLAGLRAGQTVVIQGAGGLGVYACAVAREMGAGSVIVIDGVDERLALARQFGADEIVDLREHRTPEARVKRVTALTDGWGGDVVMELVGNPSVVDEGLRMTAPEGTYLEIGNINIGWKAEFDPAWIIFGNRRILGLAHYEAEHLRGALDLIRRTRTRYPWDRVVSHKFPLEAINDAFVQQDQGHVTRAAIVPN